MTQEHRAGFRWGLSLPFVVAVLAVATWAAYRHTRPTTPAGSGGAAGQGKVGERPSLPLRQPGSPWVDDPSAYNADPDFEEHARRPAPRDYFQVLDHPPFVTASEADGNKLVADHLPVLGIEWQGIAKAYPIQVLGVHEVCNDSIAGEPIIASY